MVQIFTSSEIRLQSGNVYQHFSLLSAMLIRKSKIKSEAQRTHTYGELFNTAFKWNEK